jgi:hypothetical protein
MLRMYSQITFCPWKLGLFPFCKSCTNFSD